MDRQDIEDLRKARSLAGWSFIGIAVPLVGWVLGAISLSTSKHLEPHSDKAKLRVESVKRLAWAGIITSTLVFAITISGVIWLYKASVDEIKRQEEVQAKAHAIEEAKQESDEMDRRFRLNSCLDRAYKNYKDAWDADVKYLGRGDGRLPDHYAQKHETDYSAAKDECYRQLETGTLPPGQLIID